MKRKAIIGLIMAMMTVSLVSCGSGKKEEGKADGKKPAVESSEEQSKGEDEEKKKEYKLVSEDCEVVFENRLDGKSAQILNMCKTTDGYVSYGHTSSSEGDFADLEKPTSYGAFFYKLNEDGTKAWMKNSKNPEDISINNIVGVEDGNFLALGRTSVKSSGLADALLIKMDKDGNEVFSKNLVGNEVEALSEAVQLNDGGYVCLGKSSSRNKDFEGHKDEDFVVKYDKNGKKLWLKSIKNGAQLVKTSDGGFAVACYKDRPNDAAVYVAKYDADGNETWSKSFFKNQGAALSSSASAEDGIVLAGACKSKEDGEDIFIMKLNNKGEVIFEKKVETLDKGSDRISKIEVDKQGNYYILGSYKRDKFPEDQKVQITGNGNAFSTAVCKLDKEGKMIWAEYLDGSADYMTNMSVEEFGLGNDNEVVVGMQHETNSIGIAKIKGKK